MLISVWPLEHVKLDHDHLTLLALSLFKGFLDASKTLHGSSSNQYLGLDEC